MLLSSLFAFSGWLAFMLHRRTGIALGWTIPVGLVAAEFVWPLIFPSYTANSQAFVPVLRFSSAETVAAPVRSQIA